MLKLEIGTVYTDPEGVFKVLKISNEKIYMDFDTGETWTKPEIEELFNSDYDTENTETFEECFERMLSLGRQRSGGMIEVENETAEIVTVENIQVGNLNFGKVYPIPKEDLLYHLGRDTVKIETIDN